MKFPPKDDLTEAELAEAELVKAQKKKMPLTESQKEKMQIKQQQYADMLKKLRATTSKTDNTTYETKGKGGRKRKTRKRKTRKRKTRKRKRRQKKTHKKKHEEDKKKKLNDNIFNINIIITMTQQIAFYAVNTILIYFCFTYIICLAVYHLIKVLYNNS